MPSLAARIVLALLCLAASGAGAATRACPADIGVQVVDSRFTSAVRSDLRPVDDLPYFPSTLRRVYLHLTTEGAATLTFRWSMDGRAAGQYTLTTGPRRWHSWSSLRLPAKSRPALLEVQVLGPGDCLLHTRTLAASALGLHPLLDAAHAQLAAGDDIGARISLHDLAEDAAAPAHLRRQARRLLATDVAIAQAARRVAADELFLVESTLRDAEKRLARSGADRALRERIAQVRAAAQRRRAVLQGEQASMASATRQLLEVARLFDGDYPTTEEDARALLVPALARAGDTFSLAEWQPTLRGYRLVLQDQRTGDVFEVTPD